MTWIFIIVLAFFAMIGYTMYTTRNATSAPSVKKPASPTKKNANTTSAPRSKAPTAPAPSSSPSKDKNFDEQVKNYNTIFPIDFDPEPPDDYVPSDGPFTRQFWSDYNNLENVSEQRKRMILFTLYDFAIISKEQYAAILAGEAEPSDYGPGGVRIAPTERPKPAEAPAPAASEPVPEPQNHNGTQDNPHEDPFGGYIPPAPETSEPSAAQEPAHQELFPSTRPSSVMSEYTQRAEEIRRLRRQRRSETAEPVRRPSSRQEPAAMQALTRPASSFPSPEPSESPTPVSVRPPKQMSLEEFWSDDF